MKAILIMAGITMLLMNGYGQTAEPLSACQIQGDVIHWIADYCMAKLETDDEIPASDCIADALKVGIKNECTAKAQYKRALCELAFKRNATHQTLDQCVGDSTFMGRTVRNGGVGGVQP